ncbi:PhnD/SsuA/transferrin family substrate-binding protein [Thauera sinica]|uniref:PhnD/SsuA/transferrin family substrate-binding protein n=1 Tax=Thauera sinica TaxID=2665146 RepID=A0ABW1AN55_9RHOO|nr:PhnD/SsuA/transferrin family substrate-binding protein [Thauera sp. K11]ATE60707.1 ABC transporter substrate-binding protein [Thauera sp. K11]
MRLLKPFILLLSVALLGGCRPADEAAPTAARADGIDLSRVVLRVGAPNKIGNRPYLEAAGLLDDVPYRIEWSEFSATPALIDALRSGNVDVGGNGGQTGVIFEAANGRSGNIKVVAAGRSTSGVPSGAAILVRKDSPYHSLADLRGARLSVMKGTGTLYLLGLALKDIDMSLQDVQLLNLGNDAALASLVAGHIDAWGIWDPQATVLEARPDLRSLGWIGRKDASYAIQLASSAALNDPGKRAAIADFLGRLAHATVWVGEHPESWASAASRLTRIDEPAMLKIARRTRFEYGLTAGQRAELSAAFEQEAGFWQGTGAMGRIDVGALFDHQFNDVMLAGSRSGRLAASAQP